MAIVYKYIYKDDTKLESETLKKNNNLKIKKNMDFETKLKAIILENFSDRYAHQLYDFYRRELLKDKLNIIRPKMKDYDFVKKKLI